MLDYSDSGDIMTDLRQQTHAAVDERFIRPQTERVVTRLKKTREQGQISADFDLDLAMAILSGPLYFTFMITQEPVTHDYVDRVHEALFEGMAPKP